MQAPPKRKTPAKARQTRLQNLFSDGLNALQHGDDVDVAEEERVNRDAFWHGFGGTSKVRCAPLWR